MASERVILITGDHSKWFEHAIFIVKKNVSQASIPMDFMDEAERIIDGYLGNNENLVHSYLQKTVSPEHIRPASQVRAVTLRRKWALDAVMLAGVVILSVLVWLAMKG